MLFCQQPTTIFCHGIIDNQNQIHKYKEFIENPQQTFDFPDAQIPTLWDLNSLIFNTCSMFGKTVNREKMYMGYGPDEQTLKDQITDDDSYILFGFSRGGTAVINYLAHNDADNIKAVILNATPADTIQAIDDFQKSIGYTFAPNRLDQERIFNTLFPAYPVGSPAIKDIVSHIKDKNLPILIVHSKTDKVVNVTAAWQLYIACKQAGFHNVYLCELESGEHKAYPQSPDKLHFLQSIHSFYKKYHFDYNTQYAVFDDLSRLQPNTQAIIEKLNLYQQTQQAMYEQKELFNKTFAFLAATGITATGIQYLTSWYWPNLYHETQS